MNCDCSSRSSLERVFTCPVCAAIAYRALVIVCADLNSQLDLFRREREVSVSALDEVTRFDAEQRRFAAVKDGLPF